MKPQPQKEAERWLRQAENDLASARLLLREGFYAQACFWAQQVTEKALKALAYKMGQRSVIGHSTVALLDLLKPAFPQLERLRSIAAKLDQHYVLTRYPNTIPEKAPFELYTQDQAREAVGGASKIVSEVKSLVQGKR